MSAYDEEFESTESGASLTIPISAGNIKKGGHMLINGRPVKVVDYSTSKTGKHGHAKANITGIDIFNGRKLEDVVPASHGCEEPILKRNEYQVLSYTEEGYLSLMDALGNVRDDMQLPTETENDKIVAERITNGCDNMEDIYCTVLNSMNIEKVIEAAIKTN